MVDYVALKATASRLLTENGANLTFTRNMSTSFNPVTGIDTVTTTQYTGHGASFDYSNSEIDGTLIQRGDIRLLLEATTTPPLIGDTVVKGGITYRVMNVVESSPGGTITHYTLQLRK